jgi:hypothetical protein
MKRGRPPLVAAIATAVFCVVVLPTLLAGCAGGDGRGGDLRTYRNDKHHFSLTFEKRFVDWKETYIGDQTTFGVAFADPGGARAGDRHTDAILVTVIDLGQGTTTDLAEQTRDTLRERGAETLASLGSNVQTWPVSDVIINGLSGIAIPFAVTVQDTQVLGWDYMLIKDSTLYTVVVMSGESTWERNKGPLQAAAQSFTVE